MKSYLSRTAILCFVSACLLAACEEESSEFYINYKACVPECEDGQVCKQGECEDQGDESCEEAGCPNGYECVDGVCRTPNDVECNDDSDCAKDATCQDNICINAPECTDNSCPEGQKCVLGDCIDLTCQDTGCPDGQECIGITCEVIDPCRNKICTEKEHCEEGECKPNLCGEIVCGDTQTCYQEACHENSEFCGEEICTESQKCEANACVELDACDSTQCPEGQTCKLNNVGLPICYTAACIENGTLKTCTDGTSCVAGECIETQINTIQSCDNGYLSENGQCIVPLKSIAIAVADDVISNVDVMLDSTVQLKVIYNPENTTEKDVGWIGINVTPDTKTEDVSKLVEYSGHDTDTLTLKGISKLAGEIDITVKSKIHEDISAKAKAFIKPYSALKHNDPYDNLKRSKLSCNYYNEYNLAVFNRDLYEKFVQPKMIAREEEGKLVYYPTRASVVAAVRFLSMQFPFTFPYHMESFTSNTMLSHFAWTKYKKADNPDDVRIYGLNLTNNVYNSHENNKVIYAKSTPWACKTSGKTVGLECSGFVAWALRNGRFNGGDWKTSMFSGTNYKTDSEKASWGFNGNNVHDHVIEKFKDLDHSKDYIQVKNVKDDQIHAGDVLWHGTYKKSDGTTGSGHVAIVAGVARKEDGSVKYVYVAEASSYGNGITRYSFSGFKSSKWGETSKYKCYLIRMDNVYSYATKKYNLEEDSNAYDDFW